MRSMVGEKVASSRFARILVATYVNVDPMMK